jgi:hypothetical protein
LKAEGGKIRALTHAGLLIELGSGGKVARQEEVAGPAYAPRLAELNAAPVPASLAEAHRFAPPNRLVKLALAEGDRLAVAYWGGVLEVFDRNGQPLARRRFDQDVTALAWNGPRLLVGDADGWIRSLRVK